MAEVGHRQTPMRNNNRHGLISGRALLFCHLFRLWWMGILAILVVVGARVICPPICGWMSAGPCYLCCLWWMGVEALLLVVVAVVCLQFCGWMGPGLCHISWMGIEALLLVQLVEVIRPPF